MQHLTHIVHGAPALSPVGFKAARFPMPVRLQRQRTFSDAHAAYCSWRAVDFDNGSLVHDYRPAVDGLLAFHGFAAKVNRQLLDLTVSTSRLRSRCQAGRVNNFEHEPDSFTVGRW